VWFGPAVPIQVELLPEQRAVWPPAASYSSSVEARSDLDDGLDLEPKQKLAVMTRALHWAGFDCPMFGNILFRASDDRLFTSPRKMLWSKVTASDVVEISEELSVLNGNREPSPGVLLHMPWREVRTDLKWTVHTHPRWTTIWASAGRVPPCFNGAGAGIGEIAFIDRIDRSATSAEVLAFGEAIVSEIGSANVALLLNHGALVGGRSANELLTNAFGLEERSRSAWHVTQLGGQKVLPRDCVAVFESVYHDKFGLEGLWEAVARELIESDSRVLN
jgi:ribulose-5-phosphate 4-epimerase/fuculose-1-phosphate aldolase